MWLLHSVRVKGFFSQKAIVTIVVNLREHVPALLVDFQIVTFPASFLITERILAKGVTERPHEKEYTDNERALKLEAYCNLGVLVKCQWNRWDIKPILLKNKQLRLRTTAYDWRVPREEVGHNCGH
jgi:hypothetical protein